MRLLFLLVLLAAGARVRAADKAKRQIFREQVLPRSGGKIPAEAFRVDRLALNRLNKEGIAVPDGVVLDARPLARHHTHLASDLERAIVKVLLTPESQRFVSPEGRTQSSQPVAVDSTYIIRPPIGVHHHQPPAVGRPLPAPPLRIPTEGGAAGALQHHGQAPQHHGQAPQHHARPPPPPLQQHLPPHPQHHPQQQQHQHSRPHPPPHQHAQPPPPPPPPLPQAPPQALNLATLPSTTDAFDWLYPSTSWEAWENLVARLPAREERGAPWRLHSSPLDGRLSTPFAGAGAWSSCVPPRTLGDIPRCQTFHFCQPDGASDPLLCPSGAVFSPSLSYCNWLLNVGC